MTAHFDQARSEIFSITQTHKCPDDRTLSFGRGKTVVGDCFSTPSWGGENGFVEPRKWIAGGPRTVSRNCGSFAPGHAGLLLRDIKPRASIKFRN
jgi:hypothetical protein